MKSNRTSIEFDFEGKHYILEYTANSLKKMERSGVKIAKLDDMIITAPEVLFRGAFYSHHSNTDVKTIHKIYEALKRNAEDEEPEYDEDGNEADGLQSVLADMLREAIEEISGRSGNVEWKVVR